MGSVLKDLEARVRLERLAERPCALWTDAVAPEAVNGGQISVSWGADGGESMGGSVLEGSEGLVLFKALCKVLCGLIIKVIIVQTA